MFIFYGHAPVFDRTASGGVLFLPVRLLSAPCVVKGACLDGWGLWSKGCRQALSGTLWESVSGWERGLALAGRWLQAGDDGGLAEECYGRASSV